MEGRPAKQFDEDEIIRLMEQGQSKSSIAAHMGISRPTLNKIIAVKNDRFSIVYLTAMEKQTLTVDRKSVV